MKDNNRKESPVELTPSEERFIRELSSFVEDDFIHRVTELLPVMRKEIGSEKIPEELFSAITGIGRYLKHTTGKNFSARYQIIERGNSTVINLMLPAGGNIMVIEQESRTMVFDTGYGIYLKDALGALEKIRGTSLEPHALFITHSHSDHSGSAGNFSCPIYLHEYAWQQMKDSYSSTALDNPGTSLAPFYGALIGAISQAALPGEENLRLFSSSDKSIKESDKGSEFPVIERVKIQESTITVFESLGGHIPGQVFYYLEDDRIFFTGDSLINLRELSPGMEEFYRLVRKVASSINNNPLLAVKEQQALIALTSALPGDTLLCPGHGPLSYIEEKRLLPASPVLEITCS
jgi:glyoxylase-like metal-dependent hydrolase (beta-lactamase superfamily II)